MDHVTQQNAAMVEQSTAATHSLKRDTAELVDLMSRFTLNGAAAAAPAVVLADPALHTPVRNPVAEARSRLASFARPVPGNAALALADSDWSEF